MPKEKIALLRGINVGGKNSIKMAELRELLESIGLGSVRSYIQSGNLCFQSPLSNAKLESAVAEAIANRFGFDVPVLVRDTQFIQAIVDQNPFTALDLSKLHVTILAKKPSQAKAKTLEQLDFGGDIFQILKDVVYVHCPNGYGKTKLNNGFFETKLGVSATTRNWKTVNKLLTL